MARFKLEHFSPEVQAKLKKKMEDPCYEVVGINTIKKDQVKMNYHKSAINTILGQKFRSKTEARHAAYLNMEKNCGNIKDYMYEPFGIRLADKCTYHPDFLVILPDGKIEIHEIKGAHVWDDSIVKLKVVPSPAEEATEIFPPSNST